MVVAIDARRRPDGSGWDVYKTGGRQNTGLDALEWAARVEALGAGEILLTSMDADGTKAGYDLELTAAVSGRAGIPVIASGGAGAMEHFLDAFQRGRRMPCWRPPCFITTKSVFRISRRIWRRTACRYARYRADGKKLNTRGYFWRMRHGSKIRICHRWCRIRFR